MTHNSFITESLQEAAGGALKKFGKGGFLADYRRGRWVL